MPVASSHHTPVLPGSRPAEGTPALIGARGDHGLLEVAQEAVEVALAVAEEQDRIRDELAGAVIGDVAAALELDHLDMAGGPQAPANDEQ